ncbi:hypothetical protein S7711_08203 [Stachybotrys chartarum IBT 7711]|uniref:ATP phosphoribosyltransferase n=1 Tax=Stachybotrys chartarum (strain CBS 109288 / IBT 7711) TaxID=1280523 RepID=A0A084AI33_STACB|nr:hypothetical protein S7711_08203 [Stachybotrys chartarum IBT 7711]KFA51805.1 hypothetical protein S40293_05862 [Stachybotrys chartarum IBT 40293]KFA79653.1 hypothetical protein S40288_04064 [Stachybotrys chartarum IBT 40288]
MDLVDSLQGRLLFAVPKKGRLNQAALNLLEGADIQFRRENRLDIALVKNLPIALIFLPAADIPTFVGQGRVDLGITGWDQVEEHDVAFRSAATPGEQVNGTDVVMELEFGSCLLQVQVPAKGQFQSSRDLVGHTIGTSFVNLTAAYFAKLESEADGGSNDTAVDTRKLRTKIIELSGSVEAACALGVADGIVDLVGKFPCVLMIHRAWKNQWRLTLEPAESGETMRAAGLKAIDTVLDTSAVLIKSRSPSNPETVELIASRIRGVITAQRYVLCQYNVERARLAEATKVTPGKRAPTVTSLEEEGWVAVSCMVEKKRIAIAMDDLTRVGAQDIIVLDIHNTR